MPKEMPKVIPCAHGLTRIEKDPTQSDAYFTALINQQGEPYAQFGWSMEGWRRFASLINKQMDMFAAEEQIKTGNDDT